MTILFPEGIDGLQHSSEASRKRTEQSASISSNGLLLPKGVWVLEIELQERTTLPPELARESSGVAPLLHSRRPRRKEGTYSAARRLAPRNQSIAACLPLSSQSRGAPQLLYVTSPQMRQARRERPTSSFSKVSSFHDFPFTKRATSPITKTYLSLDTNNTRKQIDKLRTSPHQGRHNDLAAEFAHAETVERGGGK